VIFILSYLLLQASLSGLAYQYLWPHASWWNNHGIPILCALMIIGAIFFTRRFLGEVPVARKFDRFLLSLIPLSIVAAFVGSFVDYAVGCIAVEVLFLLMAGMMYIVSIIGSIQGDRAARYYLLAWSVMLFGVSIYALKMLGLLPSTPITIWSVQIGSALLVIQLSLGLVDHINVLRRDKENYARDLESTNAKLGHFNEELENRVKERTCELQEANEKLKELDQLKTDFLSTVSHELRTPLTSVLGFAKITQGRFAKVVLPHLDKSERKVERTSRQISENLDVIVSEGERLTSLINDVLDIAKLEAGRIEWKRQQIVIPELLETAVNATSILFSSKGVELKVAAEADLPDIQGDQDRLLQVLINLLSNAAKFTEHGRVLLKAEKDRDQLVLSVKDSGVGIAPEDFDKVFEKFRQVGDTLTDKPVGTGLGLPICRQIVEHHQGRIWVESEPGEGSTFFVSLLMRTGPARLPQVDLERLLKQLQVPAKGLDGEPLDEDRHILVIDDDPTIRNLLRQELEAHQYRVSEAADGLEGVCRGKELQPDLVLLDVMMPKMNGFDVAAILKNDPLTRDIPIIMLTIVEDAERGYRLGVDRYLRKPVEIEYLLGDIGSLLRQGRSQKKVLIVDANESALATLGDALVTHGFHVVSSTNENECIQLALEEKPDMIFVDRYLSDQSGLVKALRFRKELEDIFFFVTDPEDGIPSHSG
jgi:signal transduction histidine kinase/DNA-binding response OmpR family regulator